MSDNPEALLDEYIAGYEFRGDEGDYTPTERERFLMKDAMMGLLADPEFIAALAQQAATPAAQWRKDGEPDPHGSRYDCERAQLAMGRLSDDELANGAFMNYDVRPTLEQIIAGTHHSPIAWMTAVKDRIRWLSRALEKERAAARQAATPTGDDIAVDSVAWAGFIKDYDRYNAGDPKLPFSELRASLAAVIHSARQAATPAGDPAALERVARWLERLPEKPHSLPYWTNGFFANDCRDAAEVARQAATPAPAGLTDEQIDKMLSAQIPGGSSARDWFLPHDTERGLSNVRNVVRAMFTQIVAPPATPAPAEPDPPIAEHLALLQARLETAERERDQAQMRLASYQSRGRDLMLHDPEMRPAIDGLKERLANDPAMRNALIDELHKQCGWAAKEKKHDGV